MTDIGTQAAFMFIQAIQAPARKLQRAEHAFGREFLFVQVRLYIAPHLTEHDCAGRRARIAAQACLLAKRCDEELGSRAYGTVRFAGTHARDVLTERRNVFNARWRSELPRPYACRTRSAASAARSSHCFCRARRSPMR